MQPNASEREPYNGLTRTEPTLPSSAYWDQDNYKRDLDAPRTGTERAFGYVSTGSAGTCRSQAGIT